MKNCKNTIVLSVMTAIALLLTACSTPTVSRSAEDDIPDEILYRLIAYTIYSFEQETLNQNFAGKKPSDFGENNSGNIDVKLEGAYGGSVRATGSLSVAGDVGLTIEDLTYTLDNVKQIASTTDKYICNTTLNGTLRVKGSFNQTFSSLSISSPDLNMKGSATYEPSVREFNETGSVNLTFKDGKFIGEVFGHTVTW